MLSRVKNGSSRLNEAENRGSGWSGEDVIVDVGGSS
jgi:hypothetical protein